MRNCGSDTERNVYYAALTLGRVDISIFTTYNYIYIYNGALFIAKADTLESRRKMLTCRFQEQCSEEVILPTPEKATYRSYHSFAPSKEL